MDQNELYIQTSLINFYFYTFLGHGAKIPRSPATVGVNVCATVVVAGVDTSLLAPLSEEPFSSSATTASISGVELLLSPESAIH